jgi:hypothetical protein
MPSGDPFCSEIMRRWLETGFDPTTGVNPPFNLPEPLPPHEHENGHDARCGLCQLLSELARSR